MRLSDAPEIQFCMRRLADLTSELQALEKNVAGNFTAKDAMISSHSTEIGQVKKSVEALLENQEKILHSLNKLERLYKEIVDERKGIAHRLKDALEGS